MGLDRSRRRVAVAGGWLVLALALTAGVGMAVEPVSMHGGTGFRLAAGRVGAGSELVVGEVTRRWALIAPTAAATPVVKGHRGQFEACTVIGDRTVLVGGMSLLDTLKAKAVRYRSFPLRQEDRVWLLTTKDPALRQVVFPGVRQILRSQGFRVLLANETAAMGMARLQSEFTRLEPLPLDEVVLTAPRPATKQRVADATSALLDRLDLASFTADLETLVALKTRYTYSDQAMKAIDHCEQVMRGLGLETRRQSFGSSGKTRENLEGLQRGTDPANAGEILVLGHLDSTSPQASTLAPGADDNGSGAAGVLALARLFAGVPTRANLRFLVVLGEEQGLLGSKAWVAAQSPEALARIRAAINLDMIGFDVKPPTSALLETSATCKDLADRMAALAARYTGMSTQISTRPWGSDHVPLLQKKVPALLAIESEFDDNPTYHQVTDTIDRMNFELCRDILRTTAALVATMSGAAD